MPIDTSTPPSQSAHLYGIVGTSTTYLGIASAAAARLSLALASSRLPARGTRNGQPVTTVLGYFYRFYAPLTAGKGSRRRQAPSGSQSFRCIEQDCHCLWEQGCGRFPLNSTFASSCPLKDYLTVSHKINSLMFRQYHFVPCCSPPGISSTLYQY